MAADRRTLHKIKVFAEEATKIEQVRSEQLVPTETQHEYERQLDETVKRLQDQVKQHEEALQKVGSSMDFILL